MFPIKKLAIGTILAVVPFLFLMSGIFRGSQSAARRERAAIMEDIAATSSQYAEKSALLIAERSHCSIASEIEAELTLLQRANAARRNQIALIDSMLGESPKADRK